MEKFLNLPKTVLFDPELKPNTKLVYMAIVDFLALKAHSNLVKFLVLHLDLSRPTVSKCLKELEKRELIEISKRGKSTHYSLKSRFDVYGDEIFSSNPDFSRNAEDTVVDLNEVVHPEPTAVLGGEPLLDQIERMNKGKPEEPREEPDGYAEDPEYIKRMIEAKKAQIIREMAEISAQYDFDDEDDEDDETHPDLLKARKEARLAKAAQAAKEEETPVEDTHDDDDFDLDMIDENTPVEEVDAEFEKDPEKKKALLEIAAKKRKAKKKMNAGEELTEEEKILMEEDAKIVIEPPESLTEEEIEENKRKYFQRERAKLAKKFGILDDDEETEDDDEEIKTEDDDEEIKTETEDEEEETEDEVYETEYTKAERIREIERKKKEEEELKKVKERINKSFEEHMEYLDRKEKGIPEPEELVFYDYPKKLQFIDGKLNSQRCIEAAEKAEAEARARGEWEEDDEDLETFGDDIINSIFDDEDEEEKPKPLKVKVQKDKKSKKNIEDDEEEKPKKAKKKAKKTEKKSKKTVSKEEDDEFANDEELDSLFNFDF